MNLFPNISIFNELQRMNIRELLYQSLNFGMVISTALMIWNALVVLTGSGSPVVVVLSGSMEPAFQRGDLLILTNDLDDPIRVGDITVFNIEGRPIPIVHRVIKVHEKSVNDTKFLTKGDNNNVHDRSLYAEKQQWLKRSDVIGRVKGLIPYCGYMTILVNEVPYFKHILIGFMAIVTLLHREY